MKKICNVLFLGLVFSFVSNITYAQKFIRLDKINTPLSKKFYIGQKLDFTLKEYPNTWRSEEIKGLDFDSQSMVFKQDLLIVNQIDKIRTYKPWAHSLGVNLYRFSASWFVFGGIIHATTDYKVGSDTVAIGGAAFGLGLIFDKLLYKKTHKLGTRWKIRILDTNF